MSAVGRLMDFGLFVDYAVHMFILFVRHSAVILYILWQMCHFETCGGMEHEVVCTYSWSVNGFGEVRLAKKLFHKNCRCRYFLGSNDGNIYFVFVFTIIIFSLLSRLPVYFFIGMKRVAQADRKKGSHVWLVLRE